MMRECRERWLHILKIWTAYDRSTVPRQQRAVLSSAAKLVGYVAIAVIIILLAVSIFLITNTIVIGITVRKEEISIMKFIGATDAFVNAPFFVEGIAIGIIGAIIPIVIFRYMYQNVIAYVLNKFSILNNILAFLPVSEVFRILTPVAIALGIGIGALGSFFAAYGSTQTFNEQQGAVAGKPRDDSCVAPFVFGAKHIP